jgi:hypothetical protein
MFTVKCCWAVTPAVSVAWMVKAKLPGAAGVPERIPVVPPSDRPVGGVPDTTVHAIAPVPPDDRTV